MPVIYFVEMAGIEPASKTVQIKYSTNIVYLFCIRLKNKNKQKFFNLSLKPACRQTGVSRAPFKENAVPYPYD